MIDVLGSLVRFVVSLQVRNAVEYVHTGTDALQTAKNLQKKSRKCMMIAMILFLVIAAIIVLSILKPWKKWQQIKQLMVTQVLNSLSNSLVIHTTFLTRMVSRFFWLLQLPNKSQGVYRIIIRYSFQWKHITQEPQGFCKIIWEAI